jgi:hypothetical protein
VWASPFLATHSPCEYNEDMPDSDKDREQEEGRAPQRPRVVDKRVSARPAGSPTEQAPPAAEPPPTPEAAPPPPPPPPTEQEAAPPPPPKSESDRVWTPEQEAEAQRVAQEMAAVPARDWVLNVAITLANVAGTKLQDGQIEDAQIAIDALDGMITQAEDHLGEAKPVLRQTLSQLKMAYAQAATATPEPPAPSS